MVRQRFAHFVDSAIVLPVLQLQIRSVAGGQAGEFAMLSFLPASAL